MSFEYDSPDFFPGNEALAFGSAVEEVLWEGHERLREYLVRVDSLELPLEAWQDESTELIVQGLRKFGQVRPVLVAENRTLVGRAHLVRAALVLGWTHVAVRLDISERATDSLDQLSLIAEVERNQGDVEEIRALARKVSGEVSDDEIEKINEAATDRAAEWVGLPEFIAVDQPLKVVVSCDTEEDRDMLFDALGIATIHKGTRGTLSVWWPDREREDLASLRFEVEPSL